MIIRKKNTINEEKVKDRNYRQEGGSTTMGWELQFYDKDGDHSLNEWTDLVTRYDGNAFSQYQEDEGVSVIVAEFDTKEDLLKFATEVLGAESSKLVNKYSSGPYGAFMSTPRNPEAVKNSIAMAENFEKDLNNQLLKHEYNATKYPKSFPKMRELGNEYIEKAKELDGNYEQLKALKAQFILEISKMATLEQLEVIYNNYLGKCKLDEQRELVNRDYEGAVKEVQSSSDAVEFLNTVKIFEDDMKEVTKKSSYKEARLTFADSKKTTIFRFNDGMTIEVLENDGKSNDEVRKCVLDARREFLKRK